MHRTGTPLTGENDTDRCVMVMYRFARACTVLATTLFAVGCNQFERPRLLESRPAIASMSAARTPVAGSGVPDTSTDPSGVYSSVRYVEEAGDDLGMEIEVITKPQPVVVVTICEGQCWGGKTWPAVIDDRKITFSVVEALKNQDGKTAKPLTLNFAGRLEGNVLVVNMPDASDVPEERLERVTNPTPGQTARLGCNATAC